MSDTITELHSINHDSLDTEYAACVEYTDADLAAEAKAAGCGAGCDAPYDAPYEAAKAEADEAADADDDLDMLCTLLDWVDVADYHACDQLRLLLALSEAYNGALRHVRAKLAAGLKLAAG